MRGERKTRCSTECDGSGSEQCRAAPRRLRAPQVWIAKPRAYARAPRLIANGGAGWVSHARAQLDIKGGRQPSQSALAGPATSCCGCGERRSVQKDVASAWVTECAGAERESGAERRRGLRSTGGRQMGEEHPVRGFGAVASARSGSGSPVLLWTHEVCRPPSSESPSALFLDLFWVGFVDVELALVSTRKQARGASALTLPRAQT